MKKKKSEQHLVQVADLVRSHGWNPRVRGTLREVVPSPSELALPLEVNRNRKNRFRDEVPLQTQTLARLSQRGRPLPFSAPTPGFDGQGSIVVIAKYQGGPKISERPPSVNQFRVQGLGLRAEDLPRPRPRP